MNKIEKKIWSKRIIGSIIFTISAYLLVINLILSLGGNYDAPLPVRKMAYDVFLYIYPFKSKILVHPYNYDEMFSWDNIFIGTSYAFVVVGMAIIRSGNKNAVLLRRILSKIRENRLEKELSGVDIDSPNINIIENYIAQEKSSTLKDILIGLLVGVVIPILLNLIFYYYFPLDLIFYYYFSM